MLINTPDGPIEVSTPDAATMLKLRNLLPFGIAQFSEPQQDANYGFVMCCGDQEVWCIKQQPIELELQAAQQWLQIHHMMIMDAYTRYLMHGFLGGYLASPYIRQRDNGLWESGIAHFIFPPTDRIESEEIALRKAFDSRLGQGATDLFGPFMTALKSAFKDAEIQEPRYFGLDLRPRSHLTSLGMYFMVLDSKVICLRAHLREQDVAWGILAKAGINSVIHIPSVPLTINEKDLRFAKGK